MAGQGGGSGEAGLVHVWRRWTGERDVPFYRSCRLFPDRTREPAGRPAPPLEYVPRIVRVSLRYTPLIVLVATVIYALRTFGPLAIQAIDAVVPLVARPVSIAIGALIVVWFLLLAYLVREAVEATNSRELLAAVVVYGLIVGLTGGLAVGFYAAAPGTQLPIGPDLEAAFVRFPWNFLWMLLIGGQLVYDGMLRTENMFTRLHRKSPAVVDDPVAYESDFVERLEDQLGHVFPRDLRSPRVVRWRIPTPGVAMVPTAYLFAFVFVLPFYLIWTFVPMREPTAPVFVRGLTSLLPAVLDFFLVVVFFQFLVLIAFFNRLLTDHGVEPVDGASFALRYVPDHLDGYAGYRDLGRFATRVNLILVVGGIYVAYHISMFGIPTYPGVSAGLTVELISWTVGNVLPLATYVLAVGLWLYLSFWQLHKTMRRGRELQQERLVRDPDGDEFDLRHAPVWPVNNRLLVSVVSMDLLPVLPLLPFVPS